MHDGYNVYRVNQTTALDVSPCRYIVGILSASTTNASVSVYRGATTAATSKIMKLSVPIRETVEQSIPVRVSSDGSTVRVVLSSNTAEFYLGVA